MERSVLALPCGLCPLSYELQMVVIACLTNFNMVNILCISSSFSIVTYFTTFYRWTEIYKTHGSVGNSFTFTRGLVTSISIPFSAQTTGKESSCHSKPTAPTYFGIWITRIIGCSNQGWNDFLSRN